MSDRGHRRSGSSSGRRTPRGVGAGTGGFDPDSYVRPNIAAGLPPLNLDADDVDTDTDDSYASAGGGDHPELPFEQSSDEDYEFGLTRGGILPSFDEEILLGGSGDGIGVGVEVTTAGVEIEGAAAALAVSEESPAAYARFGYRPPPRSPWNPLDATLRPVPPLYPPLDPKAVTYVDDASPSIVAARIAECLRRRSVVAEYDDEMATCAGLAYDGSGGLRFHVRLYRGGRGRTPPPPPSHISTTPSSSAAAEGKEPSKEEGKEGKGSSRQRRRKKQQQQQEKNEEGENNEAAVRPDFSSGVIVEIQRVRGDLVAFHRLRRSVLTCASGDSDGADDLRAGRGPAPAVGWALPSGMAPPSHPRVNPATSSGGAGSSVVASPTRAASSSRDDERDDEASPLPGVLPRSSSVSGPGAIAPSAPALTIEALLLSLDLLRKDRLDAQVLGMEGIVKLTDARVSGTPSSILAGLVVVGAPVVRGGGGGPGDQSRDGVPRSDHGDDELLEVHGRIVEMILRHDVASAAAAAASHAPSRSSHRSPSRRSAPSSPAGIDSTSALSSAAAQDAAAGWDAEHLGVMRLMALRALSNALTVLSSHRTSGGGGGGGAARASSSTRSRKPVTLLRSALRSHRTARKLASPAFVHALSSDLGGASARPPSAVVGGGVDAGGPGGPLGRSGGSGLGCAHDAALSARCLRLLAAGSEEARGTMLTLGTTASTATEGGTAAATAAPRPMVVEALRRARLAGRARHGWLEREAGRALEALMSGADRK